MVVEAGGVGEQMVVEAGGVGEWMVVEAGGVGEQMVVVGCMGEDPLRYGRSPFSPIGGRKGIASVWMYKKKREQSTGSKNGCTLFPLGDTRNN